MQEKAKLVLPEEKPLDLSRYKNLRLNLGTSKPRKKNSYKRQLNQIRRLLR